MHDVVSPDLMRPFRVKIAERGYQGEWNRETDSGGSEVASREIVPQGRRGATLAPVGGDRSRCLASPGVNRAVSGQAGRRVDDQH